MWHFKKAVRFGNRVRLPGSLGVIYWGNLDSCSFFTRVRQKRTRFPNPVPQIEQPQVELFSLRRNSLSRLDTVQGFLFRPRSHSCANTPLDHSGPLFHYLRTPVAASCVNGALATMNKGRALVGATMDTSRCISSPVDPPIHTHRHMQHTSKRFINKFWLVSQRPNPH